MTNNVKPGDKAVIVYSARGKNGKTVGREVMVHAYNPENPNGGRNTGDEGWVNMHNNLNDPRHYCPDTPYEKHHTLYGLIWPCTCLHGGTFEDVNGQQQNVIDVADAWLRKIEETKDTKTTEESSELKV